MSNASADEDREHHEGGGGAEEVEDNVDEVPEDVRERAMSALDPAHERFMGTVSPRHKQLDPDKMKRDFAVQTEREHPDVAADIRAFVQTWEYSAWWWDMWDARLRDRHRAYWMEHAEDLADEVEASEHLPGNTVAVLEQVVWAYLQRIDPCVNKTTGRRRSTF